MIQPGSRVRLVTPDNARLHGAPATVEVLTHYGAVVLTASAGSGRFRALSSEMEVVGENGSANGAAKQRKVAAPVHVASASGEFCSKCGSADMVRAGACMVCRNCGESGGCS